MSYAKARDDEQMKVLGPAIDRFIERYNKNPGLANGKRRTVFLFPGGMASRLIRATTPYDPAATDQSLKYETIFPTLECFLNGTARDMALTRKAENGIDCYEDTGQRFVLACDAVDLEGALIPFDPVPFPPSEAIEHFLKSISPYADFLQWCEDNGLDYFVFGWDWRRRMQETGAFFRDTFLPEFQSRVIAKCGADPLADYSLVGHSAGGMVVNWLLRNISNTNPISHVITVGTPFYGYVSQVHRWFEGDSYFNGPGNIYRDDIIRTVCALPACYAWQFLNEQTYLDHESDFLADTEFQLLVYPSRDKVTWGIADPYNPQPGPSGEGRYPGSVGFESSELEDAERLVVDLAQPLVSYDKFFNVRGVQLKWDLPKPRPANRTKGAVLWGWAGEPQPIVDVVSVPGDGTQPAYSARLLELWLHKRDHVITLRDYGIDHMLMMNQKPTRDALAGLLPK
ncbi:hypothetical protein QTH97_27780 [Variovorax sp. J22R24]|uniref:hypothetical protein n=1 Tax=Variovorax gracilis TaxID=3053502 RepID=UPI00257745E6|nr:hypothetical protein [Variovorax sp. J22R24]MDM0108772.1 hypothetical protein [Variovorax sp. J22R24]